MPGAQFGTNEDMLNSTAWWAGTAYERYHFISEGDSPTYFFLFDTGLRDEEAWNYGGYSGRYIPAKKVLNGVTLPHYYSSARDYVTTEGAKSSPRVENAQLRWTEYLQHDFAVRADWCIENKYENANHRPDITIEEGLDITAEPGERVQLHAKTSDPDGDYVASTGGITMRQARISTVPRKMRLWRSTEQTQISPASPSRRMPRGGIPSTLSQLLRMTESTA